MNDDIAKRAEALDRAIAKGAAKLGKEIGQRLVIRIARRRPRRLHPMRVDTARLAELACQEIDAKVDGLVETLFYHARAGATPRQIDDLTRLAVERMARSTWSKYFEELTTAE